MPLLQRALSQAKEAKVLEACRQAAVLVDMDMLPDSTGISVMGMAGRVRKVSPRLQAVQGRVHASPSQIRSRQLFVIYLVAT